MGLYSSQDKVCSNCIHLCDISGTLHALQSGLREILVPSMVMAKFLSVAQPNTANNVETCAVLAGKLANNKFKITHVLVPKQKGAFQNL